MSVGFTFRQCPNWTFLPNKKIDEMNLEKNITSELFETYESYDGHIFDETNFS